MTEQYFYNHVSLPPISLPSSESLPSFEGSHTYQTISKLPTFKELSKMVDVQQEPRIMNTAIEQKQTNKKNNSSRTRTYRPIKQKKINEYNPKKKQNKNRCHSCNSTETPEWRKGPLGPRTLCNACGLIWTKLCKHENLELQKDTNISNQDKYRLSFLLA